MKTTGVSRRIDDLGRIVIPKEIRKNLKIRDGELLEISVDEDSIILSKHSSMKSIAETAKICADSVSETMNSNIIITDRDKVIATSSQLRKKYLDKDLSMEVSEMILRHTPIVQSDPKKIHIDNDSEEFTSYVSYPIIVEGDVAGSVIILGLENKIDETEGKIAELLSKLLSRNII